MAGDTLTIHSDGERSPGRDPGSALPVRHCRSRAADCPPVKRSSTWSSRASPWGGAGAFGARLSSRQQCHVTATTKGVCTSRRHTVPEAAWPSRKAAGPRFTRDRSGSVSPRMVHGSSAPVGASRFARLYGVLISRCVVVTLRWIVSGVSDAVQRELKARSDSVGGPPWHV
jgi:hypothetical protein